MNNVIIFDLDGTLIDSLQDIAASVNEALSLALLPPHPVEAYKLFTGDGATNLIKRALGNENQRYFEQVYSDYRRIYAQKCRNKTAPYEGIVSMLKTLHDKGFELFVLSNKDDSDAKAVVSHYLADINFEAVQGRIEGYPVKPDPRLGEHMLAAHGVQDLKRYYVGDTVTDMKCAKALRAISIGVCWGFQTREMLKAECPDFLADTPEELLRFVLNE